MGGAGARHYRTTNDRQSSKCYVIIRATTEGNHMDISPSTIAKLTEKVAKKSYSKYITSVTLNNVRSFGRQTISFSFPVTALIGTNGGGKSTVLGALALAYKSIKPGTFFPKSNVSDSSMADWRIDYELIDKTKAPKSTLARNARFVAAKWVRDNLLDRSVIVAPIQRTVPANEISRFKKFIGLKQKKKTTKIDLSSDVKNHVSRILGKDASAYSKIFLPGETDGIWSGVSNGHDYSQFHFGAGEASIIEIVSKIETSEDSSLILIEEIENGLHPVAIIKLVEYLVGVAQRKNCQVVFTTHSEYALQALPDSAIWACINGQAYQGRLSIESLRAIRGEAIKDKVIFAEDDYAVDLIADIVRQLRPNQFEQFEIHAAGGYPNAAQVTIFHNNNPSTPKKAAAIIDGDAGHEHDGEASIFRLPGAAPEILVYEYLTKNREILSGIMQQRFCCPSIPQDKISSSVDAVARDTTDHHLYFRKLGEMLNFTSEIVIRKAAISIYVENNKEILEPLVLNVMGYFELD